MILEPKIISTDGSKSILADKPYLFYIEEINGEKYFDRGYDRLIYIASGNFIFEDFSIDAGDTIENRGRGVLLAGAGSVYIAEAPCLDAENDQSFLKICRHLAHYTVVKPWGSELWLTEKNSSFTVKSISIKSGYQTSLQYHNFKEETNLLVSGAAELISQSDIAIPLDEVKPEHLVSLQFRSSQFIHIKPKTIHRIKAITDINLFEVSTPFLDDVVRIQDDTNRGHGKIESEHK